MTVNEAARHFSAVLSRVAAGDEIEVVRNGAPVAVIAPPPSSVRAPRNSDVFGGLEDGDSFADDLHALQAELKAPEDVPGI
jgi:antitoxin (DNA-binding transcriptional repressor) of toxin-antitoxin stability system